MSLQFVHVSLSADGSSSASRQQIHSLVARERHARARRIRMAKYQLHRPTQKERDDYGASRKVEAEKRHKNKDFTPQKEPLAQDDVTALPSPLEILPSDRKDPFGSMASTLQPVEHFLLDHCKLASV